MKELKCPVCGWDLKAGEGEQVKIEAKTVQVCCDDCARKLKEEPNKYLLQM